jgi:hypothetical protein
LLAHSDRVKMAPKSNFVFLKYGGACFL